MDRIGKYVVHKVAVTSGYARIFFCHDPDLMVPVAVKLFEPKRIEASPLSPAQWMSRFTVEARALAAIDHPYVVGVKSLEHLEDGRPYFVMPFQAAHLAWEMGKDGADTDAPEHDRPRRLPFARAVMLLKQLASGLNALHRRGMVHRALKPSNILLSARENGVAKLCDFSMVKLPERNPPLPDHWIGATEYCAPEQRENATGVGPQADIFSLGVLAYRMLTGTLPDLSSGPAHLEGQPAELVELVRSATDPDPAARPAHGGAFAQALERVPAERARPPVQVLKVRKPAPRPVAATA
ncbi:MAG: serine/threonine-protein kinase [Solirubrobacterales bacterium]